MEVLTRLADMWMSYIISAPVYEDRSHTGKVGETIIKYGHSLNTSCNKERYIHWECAANPHIFPHIHFTRRIMVTTQSTFVKHVQKNKQHIH